MTADLKPYPAYKDSGVPWLGSIPAGWEVRRNGRLFQQRNETGFGHLPILEVSLKTGVRVRDFDEAARKQVLSDKDKYKLARRGDLTYNMMRLWQGAAGIAPVDGLVSPAYVVAKPVAGANARYFEYLLRTDVYKAEVNRFSRGIVSDRNRLYWEDFKQIPAPTPPADEQAFIVRFLGHLDRVVARYIRGKQKLIALLNEQKQAMIRQAVTRGLDERVRLRPSRVEWLSDVPEHWDVVALRLRYTHCLGKMLDSKRITGARLCRYLRNTDVQWDRINTTGLPMMDISPDEYERYTVSSGDLLVCEGGEVGRAAIWTDDGRPCGFQKALHRLRPLSTTRDVPRWLFYALRAASGAGALNDGQESTIAHLTGDKLRAQRFAFPPAAEQSAVVEWLDSSVARLDREVAEVHRQIALSREYRTRLVTDVVTGKLDVRELATRLPEPDAPESIDTDDGLAEPVGAASGAGEGCAEIDEDEA